MQGAPEVEQLQLQMLSNAVHVTPGLRADKLQTPINIMAMTSALSVTQLPGACLSEPWQPP